MLDNFERAPWHEFYYFFARGEPPLVAQILVINTLFLIFWIMRRMNGHHVMRRETVLAIQGLLIFANATILFREDFMRFTNIGYYWHKLLAGMPF